ncbi:MAG: GGDEF domain-containing protein [Acidimicrobiia bacterium]
MNRQSGLGRGLAALLPPPSVYETPKSASESKNKTNPKSQPEAEKTSISSPEPSPVANNEQKSSNVNTEETPKKHITESKSVMEGTAMASLFSRLLDDLTSDSPGIGVVYKALYELVEENNLLDAVLVVEEPGLGKQVFTYDRRPLTQEDEEFLNAEPGLYTTPSIGLSQEEALTLSRLCAVGLRIDLLKYDAWHDPLTGLYDRRSFDRLLEMAVARSVRYQWPFTLVLIDLDGFKELNDEQGHQAGDDALRSLGERFRQILRFGDNCARIGGDEFALILPETEPQDVPPLLERIAMVNGDEPAIGFSYGLALCPSEADGIDTLFKLADERLYEAKAQNKKSNSEARNG